MLRPSLIAYCPERAIVANTPLYPSETVLFSSHNSVEMSAEETSSLVLLRLLNILDIASESCQFIENRALGRVQASDDIADPRVNLCQLLLQGSKVPLLLKGNILELALPAFHVPKPGNALLSDGISSLSRRRPSLTMHRCVRRCARISAT